MSWRPRGGDFKGLHRFFVLAGLGIVIVPCAIVLCATFAYEWGYSFASGSYHDSTIQEIDIEEYRRNVTRLTPRNVAPRRQVARIDGTKDGDLQRHLTIGRAVIFDIVADSAREERSMSREGAELATINSKSKIIELRVMLQTVFGFATDIFRAPQSTKVTPQPSTSLSLVSLDPQITYTQHQCKLLTKLPYEIREKIYRETIGGYILYIRYIRAYRRMAHFRCKHQHIRDCESAGCKHWYKQPGAPDKWGQVNLLSLLRTCRTIYSEAIPILYGQNIFHFTGLPDMIRLSMTVLPERMKLIKNAQWKMCHGSTKIQAATPWSNCHAPETCACVDCYSEEIYTNLLARSRVYYTWLLRVDEVTYHQMITLHGT